jgi:hypothetical protein
MVRRRGKELQKAERTVAVATRSPADASGNFPARPLFSEQRENSRIGI